MKLTIGIPFFNNERTLELAINSVISQTFKDWEMFLIDDGSTDNSLMIAQNFMNSDSRITLICDGMNKGLVYRLNQIIDLAKGDYIARMDGDDIMLPDRLEKQLTVFSDNPEIDVVASAVYTIDENDKVLGVRDISAIDLKNKGSILKKSLLVHPSILVKKDWYKFNKYDEEYIRAEDFELWCRTFSYTNFYRIKEPLLFYREGNISIKNYLTSMKTLRLIYKNYSKGLLSNIELAILILKTYLKGYLYRFAGIFSLQYLLTSRRNYSLTKDQINNLEKIILKLKEVEIA
jgi:glycosyltransferase involved in cell wall biosynthesis